jgi:pimeloyl-ACP methyl ester carboxylesterase
VSHIENYWDQPDLARWLLRLSSFARVAIFDKRGTGLSDPVSEAPSLDQRMDDARAVMDAVGIERAALLGVSEGGPLATLFAATYPQRCQALVLYGTRKVRAALKLAGAAPVRFPQSSISYILRASINPDVCQKGAAAEHACDESDRDHSGLAPGRGERTGIAAGSARIPNVSIGWGGDAEPYRVDSDPGRAPPVTG